MTESDNRAEKKAHLQEHIEHTLVNLHEAEDYLDKHAGEITDSKEKLIEAKNERREESIKGYATKINHENQNQLK